MSAFAGTPAAASVRPNSRNPLPASRINKCGPQRSSTQTVFPPYRTVAAPGVGRPPRTPQNSRIIRLSCSTAGVHVAISFTPSAFTHPTPAATRCRTFVSARHPALPGPSVGWFVIADASWIETVGSISLWSTLPYSASSVFAREMGPVFRVPLNTWDRRRT